MGTILVFSSDDFPLFSQIAFNNYFALCGLLACVGFILVIILSKQKLITSKDSISKPCLSEEKGGRAAAAFSARRKLGGPQSSGIEGRLHPRQHCEEAKNWDFLGRSSQTRHQPSWQSQPSLSQSYRKRERKQKSLLGILHFISLKYPKMSSIQHFIYTVSIKKYAELYNMEILQRMMIKIYPRAPEGFCQFD